MHIVYIKYSLSAWILYEYYNITRLYQQSYPPVMYDIINDKQRLPPFFSIRCKRNNENGHK